MINFTLSLCSIKAFLFIFNQSGLVQMLDLSGLSSRGEQIKSNNNIFKGNIKNSTPYYVLLFMSG